jgi:glycosyltransferase involved in cell wall biosynthesis
MRISIITVCFNSVKTIESAIQSVIQQNYVDLEYIIIDGGSNDGTIEIIKKYRDKISKYISEPDRGIYDAMNKGIGMATGEIVGILNSDDLFNNENVISSIVSVFQKGKYLNAVIADVVFFNGNNKVIRNYSSKNWSGKKFAWGFMPPHPSFFCKRSVYEEFGLYKIDYKIAADYEILIRFLLINEINYKYVSMITTKMRLGGASSKNLNSIITLNREIKRACFENHIYTNYIMIYLKYFIKILELLKFPKV